MRKPRSRKAPVWPPRHTAENGIPMYYKVREYRFPGQVGTLRYYDKTKNLMSQYKGNIPSPEHPRFVDYVHYTRGLPMVFLVSIAHFALYEVDCDEFTSNLIEHLHTQLVIPYSKKEPCAYTRVPYEVARFVGRFVQYTYPSIFKKEHDTEPFPEREIYVEREHERIDMVPIEGYFPEWHLDQ